MIFIYNILLVSGLLLLWPALLLVAVLSLKYRLRTLRRLGLAGLEPLRQQLAAIRRSRQKTIWVHALSVGEVTSAGPLVRAMRSSFPDHVLVFSATTQTGEEIARKNLAGSVDLFVPYPLDFLFSIHRLVNLIRPDLFILVETDFWPNFLHYLKLRRIPCMLVNGRISRKSFSRYSRLKFLFGPLFSSFDALTMQTGEDAEKMKAMGVAPQKIRPLGNLKFSAAMPQHTTGNDMLKSREELERDFGIPTGRLILAAGSTHRGEEEVLLASYQRLAPDFPSLFLIIAPRRPERRDEVAAVAQKHSLNFSLRTKHRPQDAQGNGSVLILDTIGELAAVYRLCDIAFVGGSLVEEGGHNPLEPAAFGKPVLFGPHMEDFKEIAEALLAAKGAECCSNGDELSSRLAVLLKDENLRSRTGTRAKTVLEQHQGVVEAHLQLIRTIIDRPR